MALIIKFIFLDVIFKIFTDNSWIKTLFYQLKFAFFRIPACKVFESTRETFFIEDDFLLSN